MHTDNQIKKGIVVGLSCLQGLFFPPFISATYNCNQGSQEFGVFIKCIILYLSCVDFHSVCHLAHLWPVKTILPAP